MSAPDSTVTSLDAYRTDAGSLLRRVRAKAESVKLMVDLTIAPESDRFWVWGYVAGYRSKPPVFEVSARTVEAAMTAALEEMETL